MYSSMMISIIFYCWILIHVRGHNVANVFVELSEFLLVKNILFHYSFLCFAMIYDLWSSNPYIVWLSDWPSADVNSRSYIRHILEERSFSCEYAFFQLQSVKGFCSFLFIVELLEFLRYFYLCTCTISPLVYCIYPWINVKLCWWVLVTLEQLYTLIIK